MAKTRFVLHETFRTERPEERKAGFQEKFTGYIVRKLAGRSGPGPQAG